MCCDNKIDLSDLRVGDEVEDYLTGWTRIIHIDELPSVYPIHTENMRSMRKGFTFNGKYNTSDIRPSIINVRRKPRIVKKTVQAYKIIYEDGNTFFCESKPINRRDIKHVVLLSGEYEEAE